jgi:hypothetical protein
MSSACTSEQARPERLRFGLWWLFRLQLLLSPVFLIPLYLSIHQQHPYTIGLAMLLAPAVYAAALLMLFPKLGSSGSRVFPLMLRGAKCGILFGSLSLLPATVIQWAPRFAQWKNEAQFVSNVFFYASVREQLWAHPGGFLLHAAGVFLCGPPLLLFILLHYALNGAVVGGVIGLVGDRRRHEVAKAEPSTEYSVPRTESAKRSTVLDCVSDS